MICLNDHGRYLVSTAWYCLKLLISEYSKIDCFRVSVVQETLPTSKCLACLAVFVWPHLCACVYVYYTFQIYTSFVPMTLEGTRYFNLEEPPNQQLVNSWFEHGVVKSWCFNVMGPWVSTWSVSMLTKNPTQQLVCWKTSHLHCRVSIILTTRGFFPAKVLLNFCASCRQIVGLLSLKLTAGLWK